MEAVFATNVFGLLNVTRAVLPHMRHAGAGHVVNITAMGGFAQVPGWGVYGATKFAVEALSESMRAELCPLGIEVTVVEPDSFRTDFLMPVLCTPLPRKSPTTPQRWGKRTRAATANNHGQVNDPVKGAAPISSAVTAVHQPSRLQIGPDAIKMVEHKLAHVRQDLEAWRSIGSSTLFADEVDTTAPIGDPGPEASSNAGLGGG